MELGILERQTQPSYCQYAGGRCDQDFGDLTAADVVLLYPGWPEIIASTIEEAAEKLKDRRPDLRIRTWRDFNVAGHVIFCQICKAMRGAGAVFADVTTLNFNLMFEIGYGIGLGLPVVPIRDATYKVHEREFEQLGLIDTYGQIRFTNSDQLAEQIEASLQNSGPAFPNYPINEDRPLYIAKSPIMSEGQIKLISTLDKSGIHSRVFDPQETARISMHDAVKSAKESRGVVVSLLAPDREGALVNNARCAFIAGVGMASKSIVLMIQENEVEQPIDYRDVVKYYTRGSKVPDLVAPFIKSMISRLQGSKFVPVAVPLTPLEKVDLGDLAAENEVNQLLSYFVPTAEYTDVKRGRGRLVIGRKGSGKSAIFYSVTETYAHSKDNVVLEIKPEAHQFTEFRETVLKELEQGAKEHLLTAFWHYLLLIELVHKIIESEENLASRDAELARLYQVLCDLYDYEPAVEEGDFSERLFDLLERIKDRWVAHGPVGKGSEMTKLIYEKDIARINTALAEYLTHKDAVWILVDNLDKGWPVAGIQQEDLLLVQTLLEATRKIQKQLQKREVDTHAVVFLRNDVFDLLLPRIRDRGKDEPVFLEWTDAAGFKELVRKRLVASTGIEATFADLWAMFFTSHVNGEESFPYILSRTLMRPRDLIRFLRGCVNAAINRGSERVQENDVRFAEKDYSEDQLAELSFELRQVFPEFGDLLYVFMGEPSTLSEGRVKELLTNSGITLERWESVADALMWFGLLGIVGRNGGEHYAYQFRYGIPRLRHESATPLQFTVHPAFRMALGCT